MIENAQPNLLQKKIEQTINTIKNAFRERPDNFLTESDLHSYIYHHFYRQSIFAKYKSKVALVHVNYPTILPVKIERGAFDVAILNPKYTTQENIIKLRNNKN